MALYRFQFPPEANQSTWKVRGNWDQGGHEAGQTNNPTDEQAYAYDFDHATGGKVLAARAGEVIDLEDKWPDDTHPEDGTPGPGNYIWIRHGDIPHHELSASKSPSGRTITRSGALAACTTAIWFMTSGLANR